MANMLRTDILSGFLKPGEFLLAEKDLCGKYEISRNSLRQALDLLANEGLIVRMVGKGNMVAPSIDFKRYDTNTLTLLSPYTSSFVERALPLLISMFNEHYPNVRIRVLNMGYRGDALRDLTRFGINSDIVIVRDQDFLHFNSEDFERLDDFLPFHEDIHNKLREAFRKDDASFAVPLTYSPIFLAGNPALFEANGVSLPIKSWSMEQFIEAAGRMTYDTNGDGLNDIYGFGLSSSLYRWPVLALKLGCRFKIEEDRTIHAAGLTDALAFLQNLAHKQNICPVSELSDWEFLIDRFDQGKIGMMLTTTLSSNMRQEGFQVKALPLPECPQACEGSLMIANGFMIPKYAAKLDLAKRFVQFAARYDFQRRMALHTGFLSIYDSVNRDVWTAEEAHALGISEEALPHSSFIRELLPHTVSQQMVERKLKHFWAGMETPSQALERLRRLV